MDTTTTEQLIQRAQAGDEAALTELFQLHRQRLWRMVAMRMDRRLQARVDVSDILQDAFVDLAAQLDNYAKAPKLPFFLWLRRLTGQRLAKTHRFHLGQQKRALNREVRFSTETDASSVYMATQLVGQFTSVAGRVLRNEQQDLLRVVLDGMTSDDREVIALRHIEQLSNQEIATELGISENAATKRYIRAIRRLRAQLAEVPGMLE